MGIEIIVVGAGVVGLAIARRLRLLGHEVLVLERHARAGMEVSSRNSEVIHAGLYYPPGSLRARLCVEGRKKLLDYSAGAGVTVRKTGKIIVATEDGERNALDLIFATSERNGAEPLKRLTRQDTRALEPDVTCVAALLSPGTAVIDTHALLLSLEADIAEAGGMVVFNTAVTGLMRDADGTFVLETRDASGQSSTVTARKLVIAAGLGASQLGGMLSYRDGYHVPRTYPAKGHYFALSGKAPFSHLIYPVPHGAWLGIHLTLDVAGRARFGPDLEWRDDVTYDFDDPDGARHARFANEVRRYWPGLRDEALQPDTTGVRPKLYAQEAAAVDFAIHGVREHGIEGLVALYGIESPGLTSSLAIGDYVAEMLGS